MLQKAIKFSSLSTDYIIINIKVTQAKIEPCVERYFIVFEWRMFQTRKRTIKVLLNIFDVQFANKIIVHAVCS